MKYVAISLSIFLLILAATVVWIRTLRSQVAQRTKELKEEITERGNAEAALRKSEAFSRTLLDSLPTGVVIVDPETRMIEHANDHVATLFGGPVDDLVDHRCHTLLCPADEGACPVCA